MNFITSPPSLPSLPPDLQHSPAVSGEKGLNKSHQKAVATHSRIWIYYSLKGESLDDQIEKQISEACQSCGCFSKENQEVAKRVLKAIVPVFRDLTLVQAVFFEEVDLEEQRFEYSIQPEKVEKWKSKRLKEVKILKSRIQEKYARLSLEKRQELCRQLNAKFEEFGIGSMNGQKIFNTYIVSSLLGKRSLVDLSIEGLSTEEMLDRVSEGLSDVQCGSLPDIGGTSHISFAESGAAFFASARQKKIAFTKSIKNQNHFEILDLNKTVSKPQTFFTVLNPSKTQVGIAYDTSFSVRNYDDQHLPRPLTQLDHDDKITAATWLSGSAEIVALGSKFALKVINYADNDIKITNIPTSSPTFPLEMIAVNNSLYYTAGRGFYSVDLNQPSTIVKDFASILHAIPRHMSYFDKKMACSDKPSLGRHTVSVFSMDDCKSKILFNCFDQVLGLDFYRKDYLAVLHPEKFRVWDIRKSGETPLHTLPLRECAVSFSAAAEALLILGNDTQYTWVSKSNL